MNHKINHKKVSKTRFAHINNCLDVNNLQQYIDIDRTNNVNIELPIIECDYVDSEAIRSLDNNSLSMFHINARSFKCNYDDVIHLIDSINNKFDIIVATETWLNKFNKDLYNIKNYNAIHVTREQKHNYNIGGGVTIFLKDHILYDTIDRLSVSDLIYMIFVL